MAQVVNEGGAQARILDAGGRLAGQAVQLLHAQRLGVLDGAVDAGAEFLDPVRVAAMPRSPASQSPAGRLCRTSSRP